MSKISSYFQSFINKPTFKKLPFKKCREIEKVNITSKLCCKELRRFKFRMDKPKLLLISSSAVYGYGYLEYAAKDIKDFFVKKRIFTVLFIPYALPDHEDYLKKVSHAFEKFGIKVNGIHHGDPVEQLRRAQGIFIGGGNTFLLLKTLYEKKLINTIRDRVLNDGIPYMGSSAGTNVACRSINNTNDMPIVYPPSFEALGLIPFNINPHYLDTDIESKHKGETREERILQYHELPAPYDVQNVLALREGSHLLVEGDRITLLGLKSARLFLKKRIPEEIEVGTDLSFMKRPKPELLDKKTERFLQSANM